MACRCSDLPTSLLPYMWWWWVHQARALPSLGHRAGVGSWRKSQGLSPLGIRAEGPWFGAVILAAMPGRNHLLFPTLLVDGSGCLRSGFPEFTWILQIVLETSQLHPYPLPFWNSVSQSQGMPHGTAFITKYGIKTVWPSDRPKVRAHIPFVFVPSNTLAFERSKWSPNSINPKLHNLMKMGWKCRTLIGGTG